MKYIILTYESAAALQSRGGAEQAGYWGAWRAYTQALQQSGVMTGGAPLQPPDTGTTLRLRNGARQVQDGPYADTKEQLGGYFTVEVPDLDQALSWAARCPGASHGAIEVRPIWEM